MSTNLRRLICLCLLLWSTSGFSQSDALRDAGRGQGAVIADPTRPPPGVMNQTATTPGATAMVAGASSPQDKQEAPEPDPTWNLQAIRHDPSGRGGDALINGEVLRVGDKISGYRLVAITRHEVLLKRAERVRRLSLLDGGVGNDPVDQDKKKQAKGDRKDMQ